VPDTVPKPETPETAVGTSPAPKEGVAIYDNTVTGISQSGISLYHRNVEDVLTMGPTEQPTPEEQPPVTGTKKIPPAPAAGEQPAVTGDSPEVAGPMKSTAPGDIKPKPSHTCPDGQHHDKALDQCVPNEPITERIKRFKAEDKANKLEKNVKFLTDTWEKRYSDLDKTNHDLLNDVKHYRAKIIDLKTELTKALDKKNEFDMDLREQKVRYATVDNAWKKAQLQIEQLQTDDVDIRKKYDAMLQKNLDRENKLTKAYEDYMDLTSENDRLKEALKRAKIHAKKTIKIKA